ncbi:MAG: ATP synthase F1 subunit delta [Sandaracinaceae bacterium]
MSTTVIGRRYATALYELAEEASEVDRIGDELASLAERWTEQQELRTAFISPRVGAEERRRVIDALIEAGGLHPILANTLRLLTDRSRMMILPDLEEAYRRIAEKRSGRVRAEIITATELPEAYFERLRETLEQATGKRVVLVRRQDPQLIGGVVTQVGGRIFDGSLRHRLREVRSHLLEAASPAVFAEAG